MTANLDKGILAKITADNCDDPITIVVRPSLRLRLNRTAWPGSVPAGARVLSSICSHTYQRSSRVQFRCLRLVNCVLAGARA